MLLCAGAGEAAAECDAQDTPAGLAELPAAYLPVLALVRTWRRAELHSVLQFRLLDLGLRRFVIEFLAPLSEAVGLAWSRGELPVRCEHFFAQAAMAVLHAKQAAVRGGGEGRPRVLLAAPAGEKHGLGIMMAEAVMMTLGADCLQLGGDIPLVEVAAAAREAQADIVALSFSASFPRKNLLRTVAALRADIPRGTVIWLGGEGAAAIGAHMPGIELIGGLDAIEAALVRWRS
jgi:methanogenic corrinoid protein MtbC1